MEKRPEEEYRVLTGPSREVQEDLNNLMKEYWIDIEGVSGTDNLTTIVVHITFKEDQGNEKTF